MSRNRINSRKKGARGEREFAEELRKAGHEARRGQQFSGSNESPDVVTSLPFHFEVKRTEALSIYEAMAQAMRDRDPDRPPVVAHKRNGKEWLAIMRLSDWLALIEPQYGASRIRRVIRSIP